MKLEEIEQAILTGTIHSTWPSRWKELYSRFINNSLAPAWKRSIHQGGITVTKGVTKSMRLRTPLTFSTTTQAIVDWLLNSSAQFLTSASSQQMLAVQNILTQFTVNQPMSASEIARIIRPVVGINEPQSRALANFRLSLLEVEPKIKAPVIEARVQRKITNQIVSRSEMIARTELSFAYHNGQHEAIRQAFTQGAFPDGHVVVKTWLCAPGCCAICQDLDGKTIGIDGIYADLSRGPIQEVKSPPRHPHCRCTEYYELIPIDELQSMYEAGLVLAVIAPKSMDVYALTGLTFERPVAIY